MTTTTAQGTARRFMRRISTVSITVLTIAAAGLAVAFGARVLALRADAAPPPPAAEVLPVSVSELRLESGYRTHRQFIGRIEPKQESTIGFEFGGRVTHVLVDEGDFVAEGDVLARLDTSLLEAEKARLEAVREALEANLAFASLSVERREALQERGFAPAEALDQARYDRAALVAQISETDAALSSNALRIEKSDLLAPFDGVVGERSTDVGTTVSAGTPILRVMTDAAVRFRVGVPLWLDPEDLQHSVIRGGGVELAARLIAVRPDIDPETRTRTAVFAVDPSDLPFGSTAALAVPRSIQKRGAWIDVKALREGAPGVWTALVVDPTNHVHNLAVEIQEIQGSRAFVAGNLTPGLHLIDSGTQRVVPGQLVRPVSLASEGS